MKPWWAAARTAIFGIAGGLLVGLLAAGVILLVSSPPRGSAVLLRPPPTPSDLIVHVSGAVTQPGVYRLAPGCRVRDALEAAGGALHEADLDSINLAAPLEDGEQVFIRKQGENPGESAGAAAGLSAAGPDRLVDINQAGLEELDSLPGIGPVTAGEIITYRQEHGPFPSIEAIQDVPGIGAATFEAIRELIAAGAAQ